MRKFICVLLLYLAISSLASAAQEDQSQERASRVEITNYHDPELRSYAQMLKGLRAYRDNRRFAPESELFFILIPKSKNVGVEGLKMRLASNDNSIDIPVESSGQFKLPLIEQAADDEYELILNKPKGQFLIRPYIKTRNLPDNVKRLGDLRLECEVRWAIEKQDVSVVFRTYVNMLSSGNPCTSRYVNVGFYPPTGVDTVTLDAPEKKISLKVRAYKTYSLPLWDKDLSDDGLIRYEQSAASARSSGGD